MKFQEKLLSLAFAGALLAAAQPAGAGVLTPNGGITLGGGNPAEDVTVFLEAGGDQARVDPQEGASNADLRLFSVEKFFQPIAGGADGIIDMTFLNDAGNAGAIPDNSFSEIVTNQSGETWTQFTVELLGGAAFTSVILTGPGDITLSTTLLTFTNISVASGDLLEFSFDLDATGNAVTIRESFLPQDAPEPASLALLGLGLAGIGFARRRRKAGAYS